MRRRWRSSELSLEWRLNTGAQCKSSNAVVRFFDDCVVLVGDKLQIIFGDMPLFDNGQTLLEYEDSMSKLFKDILLGYHHMLLYFPPKHALVDAALEVVEDALEIRTVVKNHFLKVKVAFFAEAEAFRSGERSKMDRAGTELNAAADAYHKAMKGPAGEIERSFMAYPDALNVHLGSNEGERIKKILAPAE
jgi:hypothetical protein